MRRFSSAASMSRFVALMDAPAMCLMCDLGIESGEGELEDSESDSDE